MTTNMTRSIPLLVAGALLLAACKPTVQEAKAGASVAQAGLEIVRASVASIEIKTLPYAPPAVALSTVVHLKEVDGCTLLSQRAGYDAGRFLVPVGPHLCGISSASTRVVGDTILIQVPVVNAGQAVTFIAPSSSLEISNIKQ